MSDLINASIWWFVIFIIGLLFLPLSSYVFSKFQDKGYIFSKILGISLVSYTVFLLGTLRLLKFSFLNSYVVILGYLLLFGVFAFYKRSLLHDFTLLVKTKWKIFLVEEIIFILSLSFWAIIRSYQPDIHGIEKFMDFGFVNTLLRSDYFPPKDMWFAPFTINYYYYGHFVTALLTKLSGIPSYITYNLMIATLFSLIFSSSFSIGYNLLGQINLKKWKAFLGGLLTAFLVTLSGNLQTVYAFFVPYKGDNPIPFWQLVFSPQTFPNSYWYPSATRFIYHTIHEFPSYALALSDLHGHLLDTPFTLFAIALIFSLFLKIKDKEIKLNFLRRGFFIFYILLLSLMLAIMYMTNAWDGIIYLFLVVLLFLFTSFNSFSKKTVNMKNLKNFVVPVALTSIFYFIFTLPFNIFYKPFVSGISFLCPPQFLVNIGKIGPFVFDPVCQHSYFWELLILYGFFFFWIISFLLFLTWKFKSKLKINPSDKFILLLMFTGAFLILIPETVYFKDIFATYPRANTMFKVAYQIFIMLSIASSFAVTNIVFNIKSVVSKSFIKWIIFVLLLIPAGVLFYLVSIYPIFSINSYYNNLRTYNGLNGINYLKTLYPSDYEAISWINKNIKGQPIILEAQGDSYTDYGRISVNTGLPTVLGWTVHEWFWRNSYEVVAPRIEDIKTIYETNDIKLTQKLIKKYGIDLIFIGDLEREKYPSLNIEKFKKLGKIIYQNNQTLIISVKK